ncbi:MAG TPA: class I tRNA ligase family protein, partial [Candidatus Omnitrophota bacterium]|nr:class I tRNA ligase family protein [Candidatus Omnitrophota bacterium]
MNTISSRYNPQTVEDSRRDLWEKDHVFHAQANRKKNPFAIVIPPPNVTGILHMGHALNNTLQDI